MNYRARGLDNQQVSAAVEAGMVGWGRGVIAGL